MREGKAKNKAFSYKAYRFLRGKTKAKDLQTPLISSKKKKLNQNETKPTRYRALYDSLKNGVSVFASLLNSGCLLWKFRQSVAPVVGEDPKLWKLSIESKSDVRLLVLTQVLAPVVGEDPKLWKLSIESKSDVRLSVLTQVLAPLLVKTLKTPIPLYDSVPCIHRYHTIYNKCHELL